MPCGLPDVRPTGANIGSAICSQTPGVTPSTFGKGADLDPFSYGAEALNRVVAMKRRQQRGVVPLAG